MNYFKNKLLPTQPHFSNIYSFLRSLEPSTNKKKNWESQSLLNLFLSEKIRKNEDSLNWIWLARHDIFCHLVTFSWFSKFLVDSKTQFWNWTHQDSRTVQHTTLDVAHFYSNKKLKSLFTKYLITWLLLKQNEGST